MKWLKWVDKLAIVVGLLAFWATGNLWWFLLIPLLHAFPLYAILRRNCQWLGPVVTRFRSDDSVWLTIDDGPTPSKTGARPPKQAPDSNIGETEAILEVLDRHDAKATFFTIGAKMRETPKLASLIQERGHDIGNHTANHKEKWFWNLNGTQISHEIDHWKTFAKGEASLFRSPVGMKPLELYPELKKRNLTYIGWSATGLDGVTSDLDKVMDRLKKQIMPGCIILIHEGRGHAPELLERLLPWLDQQGLKCVLPNPKDFLTK